MDYLLNLDMEGEEMDEKIDIAGNKNNTNEDDDNDEGDDRRADSADEDEDEDEDDDSDFLALQQKLIRGSSAAAAASTTTTNQQNEEDMDGDENENSILYQPQEEQECEKNDRPIDGTLDSILAPSVDELQQRIHELEAELHSRSDSPRMLQKIQGLETTNRRLLDENSQLQERIHHLEQQNQRWIEKEKLDQPIVSFKVQDRMKSSLDGSSTMDDKDKMMHEMESIVQNLQQRIMGLVEEKLQLKLDLDRMEHEIKYYQQLHPNTPSFVAQTREAWLSIMNKESSKDDIEGDDDDEKDEDPNHTTTNPVTQKDFLKIAMANKKKREPGLGFSFLKGHQSTSGTAKDAPSQQSSETDAPQSVNPEETEPQNHKGDDGAGQEDTPTDPKSSSLAKNVSGFVSFFASKKSHVIKEEDDEEAKVVDSDTGTDDGESAKNQDENLAKEDAAPEIKAPSSPALLAKNVSGFAGLFGTKKTQVKDEEGKTNSLESEEAGNSDDTVPPKDDNDDLANTDAPMETTKPKSIKAVSGFASLFGPKKTTVKDEDGKINTPSGESDTSKDGTTEPSEDQDDTTTKDDTPVDTKSSIAKNVSGLASFFGTKKTNVKVDEDATNSQSVPAQQEDPTVSSVVMESMMLLNSDSPTNSVDGLDETIDFGDDDDDDGGLDSDTEKALFSLLSQNATKQEPGGVL